MGNTETVRLRGGARGVTRRYDPVTRAWVFTNLGSRFYRQIRRNYVVSVPVIIQARRQNDTTYQKKTSAPLEKLSIARPSIALDLDTPRRHEKIKQMVLGQLQTGLPVFEHSNELTWYDPDGQWDIWEETVGTDPDTGRGEAHLQERRLGALLDVTAQLYMPEAMCAAAFERAEDSAAPAR